MYEYNCMYSNFYRYKGDPYWRTFSYPVRCSSCGIVIPRGERCFYYPNGKQVFCKNGCGQNAERDFVTMAEAEDYYGGRRRVVKARGMMGYEDYSPVVLRDVKILPCKSCRKKTPHRKFAGKYYCDMCGDLYAPARRVKRARTTHRKRTKTTFRKKEKGWRR